MTIQENKKMYDKNMVELRVGQKVRGERYLSAPYAALHKYSGTIDGFGIHQAVLVRLDDTTAPRTVYAHGYGIGREQGGDTIRISIGYDYNAKAYVGKSSANSYGSHVDTYIEVI